MRKDRILDRRAHYSRDNESKINFCRKKRESKGKETNIVCLGDLLELGLSLLLVGGVLVGVPSHGELPVRLLEVIVAGGAVDAEDLVVVDPHVSWRLRLLAPASGASG